MNRFVVMVVMVAILDMGIGRIVTDMVALRWWW